MSKTVLIADDAAFMRMQIKDKLESEGLEVIAEAENGEEAVRKYNSEKPDLVTMDITMPEMDGLEATKEIINNIDSEANIIMVSAMGQQKMVIDAIETGARDFVVKPFNDKRITEAINKVIAVEE